MSGEITRETVFSEVEQYGIKFLTHEQAAAKGVCNTAAWANLWASIEGLWKNYSPYKNYEEKVWLTLRPHIVHPKAMDPRECWRIVAHEMVHIKQQPTGKLGLWWWAIKYALSTRFRWKMEREAYLLDLRTGRLADIYGLARLLKSFYGLPMSEEKIVNWFKKRI